MTNDILILRALSCVLIILRMSELLDYMDSTFASMSISTQFFLQNCLFHKNSYFWAEYIINNYFFQTDNNYAVIKPYLNSYIIIIIILPIVSCL